MGLLNLALHRERNTREWLKFSPWDAGRSVFATDAHELGRLTYWRRCATAHGWAPPNRDGGACHRTERHGDDLEFTTPNFFASATVVPLVLPRKNVMRATEVKEAVREFFARHAPGGRMAEDAFPAWWLHREFQVSPADAIACASTGSWDHGMDAFHLEWLPEKPPTLHLVQGKFTASREQVRGAIRGFRATLERLAEVLRGDAQFADARENTVWTRLRARLQDQRLQDAVVHCRVLHLAEVDEDVLLTEAKVERGDFEEAASLFLPDHRVHLSLAGPSAFAQSKVIVVPSAQRELRFEGVQTTSGSEELFIGLGRLSDLVKLYDQNGDALFARNVRAFNYKRAERGGPAWHLRRTLLKVCTTQGHDRIDPMHFTLFHNGVTLHVTSAVRDDGVLRVRQPAILNGCQTVKAAWLFAHDRVVEAKIDQGLWEEIRIPLRVIRTGNEELVRSVTVSNNRQTAVRASGFRANDPVQIELGERFRQVGIFYERQEDAFQNLRKMSPKTLELEYPNSFDGPLGMEELAQALAVLSVGPALSVASKVGDVFESPLYERLFSDDRLAHLDLLVFSTNVLRTVHLAIKDTKDKSARLERMKHGAFRFLATRLVVRWAVKREIGLVREFGTAVISRTGTSHPFRDRLRRLLAPQNTQFQTLVGHLWNDADWPSATDKELCEQLLRKARVEDYDVFQKYQP